MYACLYLPPRAITNRTKRSTTQTTSALIKLAREHSPRVELHGDRLVILDLRGMGQLWGSSLEIGTMLRRKAADRGLMVRVAIASTMVSALLSTQGRGGLTVIPPGKEAEALKSLPLSSLKSLAKAQASRSNVARVTRAGKVTSVQGNVSSASSHSWVVTVSMLLPIVRRWGLKTLGELAALPVDELSGRLGPSGLELQQFARGEDNRPFIPNPVEEHFEQTLSFEWPIKGFAVLSSALGRILESLCSRLERAGVAVGTLYVRLTLVSREVHDRTLKFPAPLRDPQVIKKLILLDLESNPPLTGIDRVTVIADPIPERVIQFSLLDRALPSAEQLSTLLARLAVLMGDRRCGVATVFDSHRSGAFKMEGFHPRQVQCAQTKPKLSCFQAFAPVLRRFRIPVVVQVTVERGRPVRVTSRRHRFGGGSVVASAGPWRTSGDWWVPKQASSTNAKTTRQAWDREEWDVAFSGGGVYRIFRDYISDRWFFEGMVD